MQRMGSFTSAPKILNDDSQDNDVRVPARQSREEVLARCCKELAERRPPLVRRAFRHAPASAPAPAPDDARDQENEDGPSGPFHLRILQWNVLSQTLGKSNDNFVCCPDEALEWSARRYQIIQEIVQYSPDVICLQEVDHFNFLQAILGSLGYSGTFFPKPDSPCLYIQGNNGPDGCAIFFNDSKFELLKTESRILEVWRVQSNQVALLCILKVQETGQEVCIATTHLKARSGALLSTLRNEQGKDLLEFVNGHAEGRPVILSGDFNAEPIEPVYMTLLSNQKLHLASAYTALVKDNTSEINQENINVHNSIKCEPPYTTWKIREEGEICHTIDYIFYSRKAFSVESLLEFPTGEEIGKNRVPSMCYPSDHFSLCCDFKFMDNSRTRS
ncbi:hypothetical protein R5R35_002043 [Gryllus longicercus]|uniref:Nocturnin n=1 Tax=Gryllus longicercus TaxID=2509291 RepID=A0AAN9V708_9ORTH